VENKVKQVGKMMDENRYCAGGGGGVPSKKPGSSLFL